MISYVRSNIYLCIMCVACTVDAGAIHAAVDAGEIHAVTLCSYIRI